MECLTFIAKFAEATAWPIAAVVIAFGFRDQVKLIAPLIKRLKAGPLEVELEQIKQELDGTKAQVASAEAKVEVIAAKFDESEVDVQSTGASLETQGGESPLSSVEKTVLSAMCRGDFATRTVSGVAKQTALTAATVQSTYGSLMAKGLVEQTKNKEGKPRWFVTSLGRVVANES
jgi:DNA-binding MarR family transcriptional regulator